jgi:hypothetical protein
MAQKLRSAVSIGGPNLSDSMFVDNGETALFASFSSTATVTYTPISITPQDTSPVDTLPGLTVGSRIMRLQGAQFAVVSGTGMAAQTTLNLGIVVIRTFCTLSAQIANAGGAITSLPVTAVASPIPSGASLTITNATPTLQTWVTTAAVLPGATSIPVTSQTPSATFPAGLGIMGFAGGGSVTAPVILFGYSSGASGTPAFAAYSVNQLPAISANIIASSSTTTGDPYGPFVGMIPGDISCLATWSAGSITVSAGAASILVS